MNIFNTDSYIKYMLLFKLIENFLQIKVYVYKSIVYSRTSHPLYIIAI